MSALPVPLDTVLRRPDIWRGDRLAVGPDQTVCSGFAALDAELPGGGWPRGALIECLPAACGIGELSLLLPALRQTGPDGTRGRIALVAPPGHSHAPGWAAHLSLTDLLQIDARGADIAWCVELLLASDALLAVLAWLPADLGAKALRRLQLAAEGRRSLAFLFRPPAAAASASPAPLRLALQGHRQGLQVQLLKRRGPPCEKTLLLPVARPLPWSRVPAAPLRAYGPAAAALPPAGQAASRVPG